MLSDATLEVRCPEPAEDGEHYAEKHEKRPIRRRDFDVTLPNLGHSIAPYEEQDANQHELHD